jgi:hypothetical protein
LGPARDLVRHVIYESPTGYRASRTLAARLGVSTSPVLLAAYAVALSLLRSSQSVAVQLVVNNRFRPGFGGSVSTLAQSCPCLIEVGTAFEGAALGDTAEGGTGAVPAMGAVR